MYSTSQIKSFYWRDLYWIEFEISNNLNSLLKSIEYHESIIVKRKDSLEKAIADDSYLNSEEDEQFKTQYYFQFFEHEDIAIKDMQFILRNSILLIAFSIFEGKLKQLCGMIEEEINSKN